MNKQGGADDQNINQSKLRRIGFTSYDGTAVTHTAPYIASFPFSLFLAFFLSSSFMKFPTFSSLLLALLLIGTGKWTFKQGTDAPTQH